MNTKNAILITTSFFPLLFTSLVFPSEAEYSSSSESLFLSSVRVDGHNIGRVFLKLTSQNHLELVRFTDISETESDLINVLDSSACSPVGTLEKFATFIAHSSGSASYCLKTDEEAGIEGGTSNSYLLIDNGNIKYVVDNRDVGLSQCCLDVISSFIELQFGIIENDIFNPIDEVGDLDLTKSYTIQLVTNENEIFQF